MAAACGEDGGRPTSPEVGDRPPDEAAAAGDFDPREMVVRLAPGADVERLNVYYGTWTIGSLEAERVYLLNCPEGKTVTELAPLMAGNPGVELVEPNYRLQAPEAEGRRSGSIAFADNGRGAEVVTDQSALLRIRAAQAQAFGRGRGVTVAVLDTGVDAAHPLLVGRLAPGGADFVDGDGDPADAPDGVDSDLDGQADEAVGHGTAVAGLVLSVAPEATVLPIRVLDSDGVGTTFGVARGIDLARRRDADVLNMSFGMGRLSRLVVELLDEAHERGGTLIASAGNRNVGAPPQFPAGHPGVLGVAATDSLDRKADFSNFGPWISVSAPGVGLVTPAPGASFAVWSGTSFAAALVSGEAALLLSTSEPGREPQLPRAIREGVVPLDQTDPAFGEALGSGRIDILAAVMHRVGSSADVLPSRPRSDE